MGTVDVAPTGKLIPRWRGHGDLTIILVNTRVFARADQVEQLAGIPPWTTGETLLGASWPLELDGHPFYELDEAIARCEAADTTQAGEFLDWLRGELDDLLSDETLDLAQRLPSIIGSYPIRVAARLLSDTPTVQIGQQGLFAHLHTLGWIERPHDTADWSMTTLARRKGWLTVRNVTVPAATRTHRRTYPQLHVTPAGLTELARTLHATSPPAPDRPVPLPLFD